MSAAASGRGPEIDLETLAERARDLRQDHELLSVEPLTDLIDDLLRTIDTMDEWHPESPFSGHAARFTERLVEAMEAGAEDGRWVSTREAARIARVCTETIRNWCRDGKLRHKTTPGGEYRIDRASLIGRRAA